MTLSTTDSRGLIDLTQVPLAELWRMEEDSNLSDAMRRVLRSVNAKTVNKTVSAFNSAV